MPRIRDFFKKSDVPLQIILVVFAGIFLSYQITRPFTDYDEATYAKVIVDTIKSGDVSTLSISGHPMLEKPPLYFWSAMLMVKVLGPEEWAFRLPSVFASTICLWLVYLLVLEFTKNRYAAACAFLLLLFSPPFYFLARELRLDSGVLATILASLFLLIKGWQRERFLFWIFPAIALGLLIKSVIALLAIPILLIYSFAYSQWGWIRNRFFWSGSVLAVALLAPWHILETLRFGYAFWNEYLLYEVFQRATSTLTGSNNYDFYVNQLWSGAPVWFWSYAAIIFVSISLLASKGIRSKFSWRELAAPLSVALIILGIFSIAHTRLSSYVLPMYPFFAMFIAILFHRMSSIVRREYVAVLAGALLVISIYYTYSPAFSSVVYQYDEMRVGQAYKENQSSSPAPLYSFDWWKLDTMNYYGDTNTIYIDPRNPTRTVLKAPFYFVTSVPDEKLIFYDSSGATRSAYSNLEVGYQGHYLFLVYFDKDVEIHSLPYAK